MKRALGIDVGSNSIGWALVVENEEHGGIAEIVNMGSRVFIKAVEEKTPTPKNQKRRQMRLARRVLERRARRKQNMMHYLIKQHLLPANLATNAQPEIQLNKLGDPYELRTKALNERLEPHEFGRVLLHFVARRGFLSSKKSALGYLIDDPDIQVYLEEIEAESDSKKIKSDQEKEEGQFKAEIGQLRERITESGMRTLGEYLYKYGQPNRRNRAHNAEVIRTDRAMYKEELDAIWARQQQHFVHLPDDFLDRIDKIVFYQRPLKLKKDRIGLCSLEPKKYRAKDALLQSQRFRYLQDINNLQYDDVFNTTQSLTAEQRALLIDTLEKQKTISWGKVKKQLGLSNVTFNLEVSKKELKGNQTAYALANVIEDWCQWHTDKQYALVEDMTTITKKVVLKNRLINHWQFDTTVAIRLCLLELPSGHMNLSLKAITKLLPHLEQGYIYSDARVKAGYGYEQEEVDGLDFLPKPIETNNPIVNKAMHEIRHVVNSVIKQYGKPDSVRVEMARDLEHSAKKRTEIDKQNKANERVNAEAAEVYAGVAPSLGYGGEAKATDKLKYKLWKQQNERCAYSNRTIALVQVFSADVEIDHILPYKQSLDNSYMNKVLAFAQENRYKGDKTPAMAWGGDNEKWNSMLQALNKWAVPLGVKKAKKARFQMQASDMLERDFSSTQLNDTRYIARLALEYFAQLGIDVQATKGQTTAWLRHKWGLNTLLGDAERNEKERVDHRHHAIDALVIAATSRGFYRCIVADIKRSTERNTKETLPEPMPQFRLHVQTRLQDMIVSHAVNYGLSGALHEETGVGFMHLKQNDGTTKTGTVYRKRLDVKFEAKHTRKIVDKEVRQRVIDHLQKHNNNPKEAFAEGVYPLHKDEQTPIKRVRVWQSETTEKKLQATKLGVFDRKQNKIFKYFAYGNTHHVEIIRHKQTGAVVGHFVTMMEASKRVKGIDMDKQPMVKRDHGDDYEFIMALHSNDIVSIINDQQERVFYRVQKLEMTDNRFVLRMHMATKLDNKEEERVVCINNKHFDASLPILHHISATGQLSTKAAYMPLGGLDSV